MSRLLPRALSCILILSLATSSTLGCGGNKKKSKYPANMDPDAVRYRLLLRNNPVDPGEAFRCFGGCQEQTTPNGYIQCLEQCPGFEITSGARCDDFEVPPVAACMTARKVKQKDDMDPGLVVLSIIAGTAVVIALSSVCTASYNQSQCGYNVYPPRGF